MLRFDGETSFLRSMEYVTLQDIGKARWRAKRTLPGCPGDRTLRSERRCHHTGAEGAATSAHSPSDLSARRQVQDSGKKKKGTNLTRRWSEPFRHRQRKVVGTNCSTAHQWKRVQHRASCGFRKKDDLCSETKPQ